MAGSRHNMALSRSSSPSKFIIHKVRYPSWLRNLNSLINLKQKMFVASSRMCRLSHVLHVDITNNVWQPATMASHSNWLRGRGKSWISKYSCIRKEPGWASYQWSYWQHFWRHSGHYKDRWAATFTEGWSIVVKETKIGYRDGLNGIEHILGEEESPGTIVLRDGLSFNEKDRLVRYAGVTVFTLTEFREVIPMEE
jgi:hypothetical protein